MRAVIVGESPADQAAVRILVEAIAAKPIEFVDAPYQFRAGGIGQILKGIGLVFRTLYFQRSAELLVVVVDSDFTPLHRSDHRLNDDMKVASACRFCRIKEQVARQTSELISKENPMVVLALGLAVPAMEAWLLCGKYPSVGEAAWDRILKGERSHLTPVFLKEELYGTKSPNLALETERMSAEAFRLAKDLTPLERHFPEGFLPLKMSILDVMKNNAKS